MNLTEVELYNDSCSFVNQAKPELKCDFVTRLRDCDKEKPIPVFYILYCVMNNSFYATLLFILLVVILFTFIAVTADEFVCPLMTTISHILRLSENVAGVTIIALANGAPDIVSVMSGLKYNSPEIMFCSLVGGGLINTTLVAGTIMIIHPFVFQPVPLIRDCGFYLIAITFLYWIYSKKKFTLYYSVIFIMMYFTYCAIITVVWFHELSKNKEEDKLRKEELKQLKTERRLTPVSLNNQEEVQVTTLTEIKILIQDFFIHVNPIELHDWANKRKFGKMLKVLKAPVHIILRIIIPQVNYVMKEDGWSKSLYVANAFSFPTVFLYCMNWPQTSVMYYIWSILCGFVFATIILILTQRLKKPRFHNVIIVHELIISFLLMYNLISCVLAILSALSTQLAFTGSILPITLLAFGTTIGDIVTNINLARGGLPRMAIAACYAGPLFNVVFDAGFLTLYYFISNQTTYMEASAGSAGTICSICLLIALVTTLLLVPMLDCRARISFAVFLLILHVECYALVVMWELKLFISFGDDYYEYYQPNNPFHKKSYTNNI